jgi:hypothetical protein
MALIHNLIELFSNFTVLPIDPDDVKAQIIEYGVKDQIYFVGVTLDERILRGALIHYTIPTGVYADPKICADVNYDIGQERKWRRVICCKELLHILDHSMGRTATREACERLIDDLVILFNNGASEPFSIEKLEAWADTLMFYYAIAVLFPMEVRNELYPEFMAGRISLEEIARNADLPEELIEIAMNDAWIRMYDTIMRRT